MVIDNFLLQFKHLLLVLLLYTRSSIHTLHQQNLYIPIYNKSTYIVYEIVIRPLNLIYFFTLIIFYPITYKYTCITYIYLRFTSPSQSPSHLFRTTQLYNIVIIIIGMWLYEFTIDPLLVLSYYNIAYSYLLRQPALTS